jgi:hypothetical protein
MRGEWTLAEVIKKWAKKKNMRKCPCCNGTGYVDATRCKEAAPKNKE